MRDYSPLPLGCPGPSSDVTTAKKAILHLHCTALPLIRSSSAHRASLGSFVVGQVGRKPASHHHKQHEQKGTRSWGAGRCSGLRVPGAVVLLQSLLEVPIALQYNSTRRQLLASCSPDLPHPQRKNRAPCFKALQVCFKHIFLV